MTSWLSTTLRLSLSSTSGPRKMSCTFLLLPPRIRLLTAEKKEESNSEPDSKKAFRIGFSDGLKRNNYFAIFSCMPKYFFPHSNLDMDFKNLPSVSCIPDRLWMWKFIWLVPPNERPVGTWVDYMYRNMDKQ